MARTAYERQTLGIQSHRREPDFRQSLNSPGILSNFLPIQKEEYLPVRQRQEHNKARHITPTSIEVKADVAR